MSCLEKYLISAKSAEWTSIRFEAAGPESSDHFAKVRVRLRALELCTVGTFDTGHLDTFVLYDFRAGSTAICGQKRLVANQRASGRNGVARFHLLMYTHEFRAYVRVPLRHGDSIGLRYITWLDEA